MEVQHHKSLRDYNTFGIDVPATRFISINTVNELKAILKQHKNNNIFVLGGGSNMLLTKPIQDLVIHIDCKGIEIIAVDDEKVQLEVMAGENWHEFVQFCIKNNYGGVENLALIPGNVGTAPIQNIGAYGVELKDVFVSCKAIHIDTLKERTFTKKDCEFGYRNSIFKNNEKGNYIITSVVFQLTKNEHRLHTSYGAIEDRLAANNITSPTIQDIAKAVIQIRSAKLPDPKILGNSGSFFKNPVVNAEEFQAFRLKNPSAPFYEVSPTEFKIPAGWLIEKVGYKGFRKGDAGVHKNQALVLVNHGNATGEEIWDLALEIQQKVKEVFDIYIEPEVNVF